MNRSSLTTLAAAVVGVLLAISPVFPQADLAKSLVGKWEGDIQLIASVGSSGDPNRTLINESVDQKEGKWVARGRYGVTGKGLGKVDIEVDESSGRPSIRFVTGAGSTVRLSLIGPKDMSGTIRLTGEARERPMRLEKKD